MSRVLSWSFLGGSAITAAAVLVGVGSQGEGLVTSIVEGTLAPGRLLPTAYWGGVHGEQVVIALALNVLFYTLLVFVAVLVVRAWTAR